MARRFSGVTGFMKGMRADVDADPGGRDHAGEIYLGRVVGGQDDEPDTVHHRALIEPRRTRER